MRTPLPFALFTILLIIQTPAEGSLILSAEDTANSATRTWTVTNLQNMPPTLTSTASGDTISGFAPGTGDLSTQSFSITFSAVEDWNATSAQAAISSGSGMFPTYWSTLTSAIVDGGGSGINAGLGVNSSSDSRANRLDALGEALRLDFDTSGLAPGSFLNLSDMDFAFSGKADFIVFDQSADTTIAAQYDVDIDDIFAGTIGVQTGDFAIIAFGATSSTAGYRWSDATISSVPEPSTCLILSSALVAGGFISRRRHNSRSKRVFQTGS